MSKTKSTDTLVRLSNGETVESIELKNRIDLLINMLSKPTIAKIKTYIASNLYDNKGKFSTNRWKHQLMGTAIITSVPIVLICGTATAALASGVQFNPTILLTTSGIIAAEALAITSTGAYMAIKGSKMNQKIKQELASNLESLGYQITPNNECKIQSIDSYQTNNERLLNGDVISIKDNKYIHLIEEDEFVARISNLINQILQNKYPRYEDDISELKGVATDWIALNVMEHKRTGKKLDISHAPTYLYEALSSEIQGKINKTLKKVSK